MRHVPLAATAVLWATAAALTAAQAGGGAPARPASPAPAAVQAPAAPAAQMAPKALVDQYCVTCHNARVKTGGLALDGLDLERLPEHADVWEKVVRKLRAGVMPPQG